jgi:hypothetical protein
MDRERGFFEPVVGEVGLDESAEAVRCAQRGPGTGQSQEVPVGREREDVLATEAGPDRLQAVDARGAEALLEGLAATEQLTARLDPAPGFCCVRISAA